MNHGYRWVESWDRLCYWEKIPVYGPGGLFQLITYGLQDQYLTGNPQITFTKI